MNDLVQLRRPAAARPAAAAGARRLAYVETYGCQMNVADTEMVLGMLHAAGYGRTDDAGAADVILLNTCAVREKAEERVFARASMLAAHKRRPGVVLGVTGCMAEHLKDGIVERAPYVDLVVGPDGYRRLVEHVETARAGARVQDTALDRFETYEGLDPSRQMTGGVTGHITIQRGCDKFCTFCVVPYTRGRERGTPPREVLRQARAMAAAGYREIQLLGQTVNSYRHEDVGFAELLRAVAGVDGIERIRFTSPYPLDFSPAVIAAMAETPKVARHVHLPMQTASDSVLGRMRRGYRYDDFRALVGALRAAMPDVAISTDILVGFCNETEEEFAAILAAMDELRFDSAFMFAYSERAGTVAARKMPDTVGEEVKQQRLARVIARQHRISGEIMAAQVGKRERVLVEQVSKRSPDEFLARTSGFRSVIVAAGPGVERGAFLDVRIERATSATLFGRVV
ncbi:MAG TPA: tRNA (N6-isopentenyl adenosine(37)-C2)-methylthiotransferase MiaB [Polyangia bacterium]|nr:tRNA (N6-isopentenyl adenosine(37)-C2)-methylthiotransferase MiaB [Polyangia bacterium]